VHVNPVCAGGSCTAKGSYFTDDGEVLNNTGLVNGYDFELTSTDRTKLVLNVTRNLKALSGYINKNDELETVRIYNAQTLTFNSAWNVTVNFMNGTDVQVNDASYDTNWDAIEFDINQTAWPDNIELWKINSITFTKK